MTQDDAHGTLAELGEFGLIARITAGTDAPPHVLVGPGDDTAVVATPDGRVAITCDLLIEGRHFRRDWSTPIDVGRKAAAASLADVAAMGGAATSLVVGFGAPGDLPASWAVACTAGLREEAAGVGAVLVGGDVVEAPQIVLSVTAIGDLGGRPPVLRSGAQVGDQVALAGRLGWSAAGLALLSRAFRSPRVLVEAHRFPQPPYAAGPLASIAGATSMIDISDGLVADAGHVAQASSVRLAIDSRAIEVAEPLQSAAAAFNADPLIWVLGGGEDHALLATFPAGAVLPEAFTVIGQVEEAVVGEPSVTVDGAAWSGPAGHAHFS